MISQVSGARNGVSVKGQDRLVGEGTPQPSLGMNESEPCAATDSDGILYLLSTYYVLGTLLCTAPALTKH